MSRQTLILAAHAMCYPFGIRANAWKLQDKLDISGEELALKLVPYTQPLVDMLEAAEEVAMGNPPKAIEASAGKFGTDYAAFCKSNGKLPSHKEALEIASTAVFTHYSPVLTSQQDDILKRKLAELVEEHGDGDE